ncbi:MAG: fatty acid desaturase [Gammaproteobacteria bacterium]|nr:fatty acid desaturase [Gammaproteobacteria bacterium]
MAHGLVELPWWGYLITLLVMTHITIAGVTIYLHRHQAHRALGLHPLISHFFRFWLWLTTAIVTREWAAIHRKHHAKCETVDDPHSPKILGIRKVLWDGISLYRSEQKNEETIRRYGHGTPDDWIEHHLYTRYRDAGIVIMLIINLLMFGPIGLSIWAIQMAWIPFFAAGVINGLGHHGGYRNFESPDASTNLLPLGLLIGGEELHNNHHAFPASAKLSVKWWEFDIGWMYICLLKLAGLASIKRTVPKPRFDFAKTVIDSETAKAIITNRFQIMARFAKEVLRHVHKEELQKADRNDRKTWLSLKHARKLMTREQSLLDERSRAILRQALEQYHNLRTVYTMKQKLQHIWDRSATTQEHLMQAIEDWCKQAEATRIAVLGEFAARLRACTMGPVQKQPSAC